MAVIYLPPNPNNFGAALGGGIGKQLGNYAEEQMKKAEDTRYREQAQIALRAIQSAPDRDTAMGVVAKFPFTDSAMMQRAIRDVDAIHPVSDKTPIEMTVYNKSDGTPEKMFVPRQNLASPASLLSYIGPNRTLTQPNLHEYVNPNTGITLGKFKLGEGPAGSVTEKDFPRMEKLKADEHARSLEGKKTQIEFDRAAREARAETGLSETTLDRANKVVKDIVNVKKSIGANGLITLEPTEDEQKQLIQAFSNLPKLVKKHGWDFNSAAAEAVQAAGLDQKTKPAEPMAPKPKSPSWWDNTMTWAGNQISGGKPKSAGQAATPAGAQTSGKILPSANAKGWKLMRDKVTGAKAYVGPKGEIEEVD